MRSHGWTGAVCPGRKTTEAESLLLHIWFVRVQAVMWLTTVDADLDHLAEVMFSDYYCKVISPHTILWKKVTICNPHWRGEKLCSPPHWGQSIYIHYLEFFTQDICLPPASPSIYSCNHLFIPVWTQGYLFYIWVIRNHCIFILFTSPQLWPVEPLDLWSFGVLSTSLLSGTISFSELFSI